MDQRQPRPVWTPVCHRTAFEVALEVTTVRHLTGPRSGPEDRPAIKVEIPWELHQAIIRIQARDDLGFEGACLKAATLLDPRSESYKKAVSDEANKLVKSTSMIQINKARKTIQDSAYQRGREFGHNEGYNAGYGAGYNAAVVQFNYPCASCGRTIYAAPQNEWKWLVENGHLSGWRCSNCLSRRT